MNFDNVSSLTIPEGEVGLVKGEDGTILWGKNLLTNFGSSATSLGVKHTWTKDRVTLSGTSTSTYSNITNGTMGVELDPGEYIFSIYPSSDVFRAKIRLIWDGSNHDFTIPKGDNSTSIVLENDATIRLLFIDQFPINTEFSYTYWLRLIKVS